MQLINRQLYRHWHGLAFVTACGLSISDYHKSRTRQEAVAEVESNPLLLYGIYALHLPRYAEVQSHHVKTATDYQVCRLRDDFDSLLHGIETREGQGKAMEYGSIVEELERMKAPLESTLAIVEHLLMVNQSDPLKFAHNMSLTSVIQLHQDLTQSPEVLSELYKLKTDSKTWKLLSPIQRKVVNMQIRDMQRNGVGLSTGDKNMFNELQMSLSHLQAKFNSNVFKSTQQAGFKITLKKQTSVEGMPESLRHSLAHNAVKEGHPMATAATGPWVVTLDNYHACMQHLKSSKMRQVLHQQHTDKASAAPFNNSTVIHDILKDKQSLARLLGFENYADLSLDSKMAPDVAAVLDLFTTLREKAYPLAQKEMTELKEFVAAKSLSQQRGGKGEVAGEDKLAEWDIPYWSERLKEHKFQLTQEDLKVYFPLNGVLEGLFALIERLFAVRVEEAPRGRHQVWHPDVRVFYIFPSCSPAPSSPSSSSSSPMAVFYLDPYSRPGRKRAGNWMHPMNTKSEVLRQDMPVAHLVLNITPPPLRHDKNGGGGGGEDALLTLDEVTTLFHETGHGLQHMLTSVKHGSVSGINNIPWDTVELPSQFMENWVYDKHTVCSFAKHHLTGAPLPEELFVKMKAAKDFQAGRRLLRQLYLGACDLALHSAYDPMQESGQTPQQFIHNSSSSSNCNSSGSGGSSSDGNNVLAQFLLDPPLSARDTSDHASDLSELCSFSHIFSGGYAAGYYGYIWAEVMSADAFAAFEEAGSGLENKNDDHEAEVRATGVLFRDTILAMGGGTDAAEVYRLFRGRDAAPAALLRHRGIAQD